MTKDLVGRDAAVLSNVMMLRFYPLAVESGQGAVLKGFDGTEYLDFSAGWGVANTGYNHPKIVEAVKNGVDKFSFLSTISAINEESVLLGEKLVSLTPGDFPKQVWYGHSGSDANDFIAKIVPLASGRPKLLTFVGSYHGQTMGAYGMSGHPAQSHFMAGGNVVKIPYPYCYRCPFLKEPDSCGMYCADYFENYILPFICAPDQVGAIVAESIQCDGGDVVPPDAYFPAAILRQLHKGLL
jgi:4-aminobutyrate aminotransferase